MRETQINKTKLDTITPKDTYDITTPSLEVFAKRTDPHVDAGSPNKGNVEALTKFAGSINQGLASYMDYKKYKNKEDEELGAFEKMRGTKREDIVNKSEAFIRGYEQLEGKLDAVQNLNRDAAMFLEENRGLTAEEFSQKFGEQIINKYVNGKSNNYLRGLFPEALNLEKTTLEKHAQGIIADMVNKRDTAVNTEMNTDVVRISQDMLGLPDLDVLRTDYVSRKAFNDTSAQRKGVIAPKLREYLDTNMAKWMQLGLTKQQAYERFFENVAQVSITYGMPELMGYAYEVSKVTGYKEVNNEKIREGVMKAESQAMTQARTFQSALKAAKEDKDKEKEETTVNQYLMRLTDIKDVSEAMAIKNELNNPEMMKLLPPDKFSTILAHVQNVIEAGGKFPAASNNAVLSGLQTKLLRGTLTQDDIVASYSSLSKQDRTYLINEYQQQQSILRGYAKQDAQYDRQECNGLITATLQTIRTDKLNKIEDADKPLKALQDLQDRAHSYKKKNGVYPTGSKFDDIREAHRAAFPTMYDIITKGKGSTPATPAMPSANGEKPKTKEMNYDPTKGVIK